MKVYVLMYFHGMWILYSFEYMLCKCSQWYTKYMHHNRQLHYTVYSITHGHIRFTDRQNICASLNAFMFWTNIISRVSRNQRSIPPWFRIESYSRWWGNWNSEVSLYHRNNWELMLQLERKKFCPLNKRPVILIANFCWYIIW